MMYVDGGDIESVYRQAGLSGYVDGPYPFEASGLKGLGFGFDDVVGGFSIQTVALVAGTGLILWMMFSRASASWDVGMQKLKARDTGRSIKGYVDKTVTRVTDALDKGDLSTANKGIDWLDSWDGSKW